MACKGYCCLTVGNHYIVSPSGARGGRWDLVNLCRQWCCLFNVAEDDGMVTSVVRESFIPTEFYCRSLRFLLKSTAIAASDMMNTATVI